MKAGGLVASLFFLLFRRLATGFGMLDCRLRVLVLVLPLLSCHCLRSVVVGISLVRRARAWVITTSELATALHPRAV